MKLDYLKPDCELHAVGLSGNVHKVRDRACRKTGRLLTADASCRIRVGLSGIPPQRRKGRDVRAPAPSVFHFFGLNSTRNLANVPSVPVLPLLPMSPRRPLPSGCSATGFRAAPVSMIVLRDRIAGPHRRQSRLPRSTTTTTNDLMVGSTTSRPSAALNHVQRLEHPQAPSFCQRLTTNNWFS